MSTVSHAAILHLLVSQRISLKEMNDLSEVTEIVWVDFKEPDIEGLVRNARKVADLQNSQMKNTIDDQINTIIKLKTKLISKYQQYLSDPNVEKIKKIDEAFKKSKRDSHRFMHESAGLNRQFTELLSLQSLSPAQKWDLTVQKIHLNDLYNQQFSFTLSTLVLEVYRMSLENPYDRNIATERLQFLKSTLQALPLNIQGDIYGKIWELSPGLKAGEKWGEIHALDDLNIFRDAVHAVALKQSQNVFESYTLAIAEGLQRLVNQMNSKNPDKILPKVALTPSLKLPAEVNGKEKQLDESSRSEMLSSHTSTSSSISGFYSKASLVNAMDGSIGAMNLSGSINQLKLYGHQTEKPMNKNSKSDSTPISP